MKRCILSWKVKKSEEKTGPRSRGKGVHKGNCGEPASGAGTLDLEERKVTCVSH